MSDLVPYRAPAPSAGRSVGDRLVQAFLAGRTEHTMVAYGKDLAAFAAFLNEPTANAAMTHLLSLPAGEANGVMLEYRSAMHNRKLTPATINRRLSAIRAAVKIARTLGMTQWTPEVEGLKAQSYRDTKGPGLDGTRAMLARAKAQADPIKAARDAALIRLMFDMGLRRGEVVALDLEDLDRAAQRLSIKGKGRAQKEHRTIPGPTLLALQAWLALRGQAAVGGERAIFVGLRGSMRGHRITGNGLFRVVSELGAGVGIVTRPHGLRHASITHALQKENGNIAEVQKHARHSNPQTTMIYNDARVDSAGRIAQSIADDL